MCENFSLFLRPIVENNELYSAWFVRGDIDLVSASGTMAMILIN